MIGGGGEQKTLRLVAQYADATNVFGGPEGSTTSTRCCGEHCEAVGRTVDEIERSTLQAVRLGGDGARRTPNRPAEIVDRFGELSRRRCAAHDLQRPRRRRPGRLEIIGRDVIPQLRDL